MYNYNKPNFMNNTNNTVFGATTSTFGQPAATNMSMFSSMQPSNIFQSPTSSGFTTPTTQQNFGSQLFGQPQQPTTSSIFGNSANSFGQNKPAFGFGAAPSTTNLFGQTQPQQPQPQTSASLFQSPSQTSLFGGSSFGNQISNVHVGTVIKFQPVTGTDTMQKNGVATSISTKHHCITCMKEYESKSFEELRFEDYSCNRKGPQQQAGFGGATPFGGAPAAATPSLFGQNENKAGFGQTANTFGQASTFGQNNTFGVASSSATTNLFAKPAFGAPTTNPSTFGFQTTTSNPFNNAQQQKTFASPPLFGAPTSQTQSTFGTSGVFGQTNAQQTAGLFQKPVQQQSGFQTNPSTFSFNQPQTSQAQSLFQASKPQTGFGVFSSTNTGTTTFGQPAAQQSFGNAFGNKTAPSLFTQPQQSAFGTSLGTGLAQQQPSLFGNQTAKPPTLFGGGGTGGGTSLFTSNVFQPQANTTNFSMNPVQQQQTSFPPEQAEGMRSVLVVASDIFPDGTHILGLDPILTEGFVRTTNPKDLKAVLDYSKSREACLSPGGTKIKITQPKPRRDNFSREFFETVEAVKASRKCLMLKKFKQNPGTIYNKYKNELIEEVDKALSPSDELTPPDTGSSTYYACDFDDVIVSSDRNREIELGIPPLEFNTEASTNTTKLQKEQKPTSEMNGYIKANGLYDDMSSSRLSSPRSEHETIESESIEYMSTGGDTLDTCSNIANVKLTRPEYYMMPEQRDLVNYMNENGECVVRGLTIGRKGYGNIYYSDPIVVNNLNLDDIVFFRHREVIVYPDDENKPPIGQELNRPAQVTLDKIFPREKGTKNYITDIDEITTTDFVDKLMKVTSKHNCTFVDYRPQTGSWVFKVKHFSKYSYSESDEEDCEVKDELKPAKPTSGFVKKSMSEPKLKTISEYDSPPLIPPPVGLRSKVIQTEELEDESQKENLLASIEEMIENHSFDVDSLEGDFMGNETIIDYYKPKTTNIQSMKMSLFSKVDSEDKRDKVEEQKKVIKTPSKIEMAVPKQIFLRPRIFKVTPPKKENFIKDQDVFKKRCYIDLGIFKTMSNRVAFKSGLSFYTLDQHFGYKMIHNLNSYSINPGYDKFYSEMLPRLSDLFKICLDEAQVSYANDIPTYEVKDCKNYLRRQTYLFNAHARSKELQTKSKYLSNVWNLCTALWEGPEISPFARKQNLSKWLKLATQDLHIDNNTKFRPTVFEEIFKLLSFDKIKEASKVAAANKLHNLSLMITQLNGNERVKMWARHYIDYYGWTENKVPVDFKKVYLLLSGLPVDEFVNVFEELDWLRSFALHFWFIAPTTSPMHVALSLYKNAFEEAEYAVCPHPPYTKYKLHGEKSSSSNNCYDLIYHIIALYNDSTYQLCELLHPQTHTECLLDYRLSWFLLLLFQSLNVGLLRDSEEEYLHTSFSNQLEHYGYWKWAIYVLLYLKNNHIKKTLVLKVLDRHLSDSSETLDDEIELVNVYKVPTKWIHKVKATKAEINKQYYKQYQHLYLIKDIKGAGSIFMESILPDLFINDQMHAIKYFVEKLRSYDHLLENWYNEYGLFQTFLELDESMQLTQNEQCAYKLLDQLVKLNTNKSFRPRNVKQKLCLAELSRKCALIYKIIKRRFRIDDFEGGEFDTCPDSTLVPPDYAKFEILHYVK